MIKQNKDQKFRLSKYDLIDRYNKSVNYYDMGTQLINYEKNKIRYVYNKKGDLYFRGNDICKLLEYNDIKQVLKNLDETSKISYENILPRGGVLNTPPPRENKYYR